MKQKKRVLFSGGGTGGHLCPAVAVAEELRDAGHDVRLFLASSSEVYGKNPIGPWAEDADLVIGPTNRSRWSYGAAKALDLG